MMMTAMMMTCVVNGSVHEHSCQVLQFESATLIQGLSSFFSSAMSGYKVFQATVVEAPDGSQWAVHKTVEMDGAEYAVISKNEASFKKWLKAVKAYGKLSALMAELQKLRAAALEEHINNENPFGAEGNDRGAQTPYKLKQQRKRAKQSISDEDNRSLQVTLPEFYTVNDELVSSVTTTMPLTEDVPSNALLLALDADALHWVRERCSVLGERTAAPLYARHKHTEHESPNKGIYFHSTHQAWQTQLPNGKWNTCKKLSSLAAAAEDTQSNDDDDSSDDDEHAIHEADASPSAAYNDCAAAQSVESTSMRDAQGDDQAPTRDIKVWPIFMKKGPV